MRRLLLVSENVEEVVFEGKSTRADEIVKVKTRDELIKEFGAIKVWSNGSEKQ